jgi:penicillin V acylase-like amidase (Ntn superfamily)
VHVSLSDKSGDSAVIEYIGGKARIYHDKRFTVMTNEPTYDKQIENLKQYRTFGGDKPLPGERTPSDRFVRAAYYANGLPKPASQAEGAAYMFSVIRNVSVPFGSPRPGQAERRQHDLPDRAGPDRRGATTSRAPTRRTWSGSTTQARLQQGQPERELQVEKKIFSLNGDVTEPLQPRSLSCSA